MALSAAASSPTPLRPDHSPSNSPTPPPARASRRQGYFRRFTAADKDKRPVDGSSLEAPQLLLAGTRRMRSPDPGTNIDYDYRDAATAYANTRNVRGQPRARPSGWDSPNPAHGGGLRPPT